MGVAVLHTPSGRTLFTRRIRRAWTDERLVARIRAGDDAAFEALYDRYHRDLLAFCRHMLASREEAEDALQHTFLQAHRVLRGDDRPMQPRAWLFAVARNHCVSVLRARRQHVDVDEAVVATEGLAAEVQRRDDLRALLADLQRLPEDQRAALVLAELGAHSHAEIAAVLEVRAEKVKALVFQAREGLLDMRAARDADCRAIREELASVRGGALRRTHLRRHLDVCPGCRAFREDVRRQRAAMAAVLPVAPSLALKSTVLGAVLGGGVAAGVTGVAGGGGLGAAGGMAGKALVALALAGGTGAGGFAAVDAVRHHRHHAPRAEAAVAAVPPRTVAPSTEHADASHAPAGAVGVVHRTMAVARRRAAPRRLAPSPVPGPTGRGESTHRHPHPAAPATPEQLPVSLPAPQRPAHAQAPHAQAPQTQAPQTQAPHTQAPQTQPPQAHAQSSDAQHAADTAPTDAGGAPRQQGDDHGDGHGTSVDHSGPSGGAGHDNGHDNGHGNGGGGSSGNGGSGNGGGGNSGGGAPTTTTAPPREPTD